MLIIGADTLCVCLTFLPAFFFAALTSSEAYHRRLYVCNQCNRNSERLLQSLYSELPLP